MGLGCVAQLVGLVDRELDGAVLHDLEQLARRRQQILAPRGIGVEGRAGQEQRTLAGEDADIDRSDGARAQLVLTSPTTLGPRRGLVKSKAAGNCGR